MAGKRKKKKKKKLTAVLWRAPITSAALNATRLVFRTLWSEEVRAICHATLSFGRETFFFLCVLSSAAVVSLGDLGARTALGSIARTYVYTHSPPDGEKRRKTLFFSFLRALLEASCVGCRDSSSLYVYDLL